MARHEDPTAELEELSRRYRETCASLAELGFIATGSLTRRYTHCNRSGCRCGGDPPALHGPYWQWTTKIAGKTVTRRLSDAEAALYAEQIANERALRATIEKLRSLASQARELLLASQSHDRAESRPRRSTPRSVTNG